MSDVPQLTHGQQYVGSRLPPDEDGSENAGFVVFGESDGHDVLFWSCAYMMSPAERTQWLVPDARIHATIFMAIPRVDDARLGDNDFVRSGLHLPEYIERESFRIVEGPDSITWEVEDRRYTWDPPHWRISGEHAGVDVDLEIRAAGEASWSSGPFETITENRSGGYDVPITASGRVSVDGNTFVLTDAHGSHERVAIGQGRDIIAEVGGGAEVFVADLFADGVHVWFGQHTGRDLAFGRVDAGERSAHVMPLAGQGTMTVETVDRWSDPRSGLLLPSRWHVVMAADDGTRADFEVVAVGRAYWHYTTSSGVMVMVWQLSKAAGSVTLSDGVVHDLDGALVASRWGRSLLVADETLSGSRFVAREALGST